jgi:hypothetical protein
MLSRDRLLDSGPVTFVAFTEVIAADSCVVWRQAGVPEKREADRVRAILEGS